MSNPPPASINTPFPELAGFVRHAMPHLFRKLRHWKGFHAAHHPDLVEDLHQELALDCLENRDLIARLTVRERHGRWFRLVENHHYKLRTRGQRRLDRDACVERLADTQVQPLLDPLPAKLQIFITRMLATPDRMQHLKNGRLNAVATAHNIGMDPRELRAFWSRLANALGYGEEYLTFWRRRLVEALVSYAVDSLRDIGLLESCHLRSSPDPQRSLQRIRHIRAELSRRPLPSDMKSVLVQFRGTTTPMDMEPDLAVKLACKLQPKSSMVHLWSFEIAMIRKDLPVALRSVRIAKRVAIDPVPITLARARILKARGLERLARRLLQRSHELHNDHRLSRALVGHEDLASICIPPTSL